MDISTEPKHWRFGDFCCFCSLGKRTFKPLLSLKTLAASVASSYQYFSAYAASYKSKPHCLCQRKGQPFPFACCQWTPSDREHLCKCSCATDALGTASSRTSPCSAPSGRCYKHSPWPQVLQRCQKHGHLLTWLAPPLCLSILLVGGNIKR